MDRNKMDYNKVIKFLFMLAVVICPLIFFTNVTRNPYAIQQVIFYIVLSAIIALLVFRFNSQKKMVLPRTALDRPLAVFFVFCVLTVLNSYFIVYPQWKTAILSFGGRRIQFLLLNAIMLFYITVDFFGDSKGRKKIMWALFFAATLASLYGILQYLGIELIWSKRLSPYGARSVSSFGNPNFMSSYLLLIIPVLMTMLLNEKSLKKKLVLGSIGLINLLGLIVTETRSSWLGLFVAMGIIIFVLAVSNRNIILENKKWLILLTVMITLVVMIPLKESNTSKRSSIFTRLASRVVSIRDVGQSAYTQRFLMWSAALSMVEEHPLVGVGWGNYEIIYPFHQSKYLKMEHYSSLRTHSNNTHNEILEIVSQVGIIGLGLYIWLFWVFFRRTIEIYKKTGNEYNRILVLGLGAGIVGMFVDNMLNVSLHFPMPAIPFWINIGLIIAIGRDEGSPAVYKIIPKKKTLFMISLLAGVFVAFVVVFNVRYFSGEMHYFKGFKSARQNNLKNSVKECLLSYKIYPLNVDNNYELGNAYARLKDKENAAWAYKEAIKANPGYDEIYFNLGVVYAQLNRFDEAIRMISESIRINPLFKDSYLNLGNIYIQKERWKEAVESFRECLALQPDDKVAKQNLSYALTRLFGRGQEYIDKKEWGSAEMAFREITELVPADVKAHLYLGNIYFSNEKFESSITEYRKVLEMSGKKDINIMNNLGLAYIGANKNDLAAKQFREVLKIDHNNFTALNKLKEMKKGDASIYSGVKNK